jgi:hypothetical protein
LRHSPFASVTETLSEQTKSRGIAGFNDEYA